MQLQKTGDWHISAMGVFTLNQTAGAEIMDKLEMHHLIMAAKARKGLSWDDLANAVGKAPVWLASVCYGMNSAPLEVATHLCEVLELDDRRRHLNRFPSQGLGQVHPSRPADLSTI
jgi:cyanate lyase